MPDREIYCVTCNAYLGVIRDAKLRNGMGFICSTCIPLARAQKKRKETDDLLPPDFKSIFGI